MLDFSQLIAGPSAGVMLADLGAEVIKIERPTGELGRTVGPEVGVPATFAAYNRGKRALAVDMTTPEGREVISRLVATSDVLIQNFRPGVMERLGFGYEALHAAHPGLVYASLSAYNPDGPGRNRPGTDAVLQAESGLMAVTGPEDGDPYKVGVQIIDAATGLAHRSGDPCGAAAAHDDWCRRACAAVALRGGDLPPEFGLSRLPPASATSWSVRGTLPAR